MLNDRAAILLMFWKSKLLTKDRLGLMQQCMLSSVTKLNRFFFFLIQGAMGFAQKRLLSGKKQLIINCIKLFEKCSHSWQCFSVQQLSSFTLIKPIDISPRVHSARPGCCSRGRHESQAAAPAPCPTRWGVPSCSCHTVKSSPKPQITSSSFHFHSAFNTGHDTGGLCSTTRTVGGSLNSKGSKALGICMLSPQKHTW